ncbi:MAG: Lipoteichoic acid synthase 2 [Lentisphaerae bacterium ADurb.Bin242]|nr:MAG: Lipoteichoic acid synthase 2 [Lentisphaerae bacterium ADurb.Bin242]
MKKLLPILVLMNVSWIVRLFFEKNSDCDELVAATAISFFVFLLSEISPWRKNVWRSLALFFFGFYLFFQFCCDVYLVVTGKELDFQMLNNFDVRVGFLLFGKWIVGGLLLYVVFLLLAGICIFFIHDEKLEKQSIKIKLIFLAVSLGTALYFTPVFSPFMQKIERNPDIYPEIVFRNAGIKLSGVTKKEVSAVPGKNLVVIFMESIENTFMDSKRFPGLTPHLEALAEEGLSFTNISNGLNADDTFSAQYSVFMGLPILPEQIISSVLWMGGLQDRYGGNLPSLPFILHKAGYQQIFLQGPSMKFAGMNLFLQREKVDSACSYESSGNALESGSWGCSDRQLFEWSAAHFEKLSSSGKPFALYLTTIDTHLPSGFLHKDSEIYPWENEKERHYLSAVRTTDREIGKFIARLRKSKEWKNTVVVMMTDHFLHSSNVDSLLAGTRNRRHVGIVLNSGFSGVVKTPGATSDWAPTLLSLIHVKHNHTFPLGENLLGKTNPARLAMTPRQKNLIFCFLAKHEAPAEKTAITVTDEPYWALKYNGRTFPFYKDGGTYSQDKNNITFIPLNMNREPESFIPGNRRLTDCGIANKEFLAVGYTNGSIQKLFEDVKLPPDQWCLAYFAGEERKYVCAADIRNLKLNW